MKYTINDGFPYYIELVEGKDYKKLFAQKTGIHWFRTINEQQSQYTYEPGKWTVKQIIGHIADHERIMMYRALRFSRKDQTLLAGYNQELFVANSSYNALAFEHIVDDLENVRNATNSFIHSLTTEQLQLTGTAWKYELTVEDFLKATIGHELHHINVLREKYRL
ncbi:DinB family protein [Panacibacter sp. DH6]|uniref:DinB family protein n=1 Tax=Panacibacter microcysteis TaxID=2793269 RepID=A0A931GW65_9BACT|nr:DinB family protein [Panacibacter microcysteis]MBG9377260.1 DinB family protein [Panacibacter microcysteis]